MSLLAGLTSDTSIKEEKDTLGGGGFILESDAYKLTINLPYVMKSAGGAMGLVLHCTTEDGKNYRETLWMTSGTAKGCLNYYVNKSGEKQYLPGFAMANAIAIMTTGKEIAQLETEVKVANIYNKEAAKEVPTKVDVITDLVGKVFVGGILKQLVDKTVQDSTGAYVPNGETRDENVLDKIFNEEGLTLAELRAGKTEAEFLPTWTAKWKDQVKDRSTKGAVAPTGMAGAPAAAAAKPTKSLFA